MVRKVHVHLLDDLDGSQADETVTFALDGTTYEIELSSANATQMRSAFKTFIDAGRRAGRGLATPAGRGHRVSPGRSDRTQNQAIRNWAKRKGLQLSDRGRIPATIVQQFEAEAGR